MNRTIDYFIDSETDLASFEYYFEEEELNIKSVTLKSIMLYTAHKDLKKGILFRYSDSDGKIRQRSYYEVKDQKEFNLNDFCDFLNRRSIRTAVEFHNDKNHIILELLENEVEYVIAGHHPYGTDDPDDPEYNPNYILDYSKYGSFIDLFGFEPQVEFNWKGKCRSPKSIIDTPPILFLRSNLVDKKNTFYNNKYSDIFCEFPADIDIDAHKLQTYEPPNCTKNVYKRTNHLKFEITDENGKVINFRGKPVKIHLSFEVLPLINAL